MTTKLKGLTQHISFSDNYCKICNTIFLGIIADNNKLLVAQIQVDQIKWFLLHYSDKHNCAQLPVVI